MCGFYLESFEYEKPFFWGFANSQKYRSEKQENKERTDSSIARARQNLYRIILSNLDDKQPYKNLFVTLTFKENETNIKKANYQFKKFIQRFNYHFAQKLKYITVIEFQDRGAVHYHTLFFNIPYIKDLHLKIEKLWGLGYTEVKLLRDIKNVSAYVSKYIRKGFFDKRLSTQKAYFCSRSCIYPKEFKTNENIDNILNSYILENISVATYETSHFGLITKKTYKLIDKKS